MSGPITCGYLIVHGVLFLAARAIEEARALGREYGAVLDQMRERELALAQARHGQRNARLERLAAVRGEAARQSARFARLVSLAQTLEGDVPGLAARMPGAVPPAPDGSDDAAWSEHLRKLDTAVRELESLLADAGSVVGGKLRAALAASTSAPTIDDVLSAYVLQRQLKAGLDAAQAERFGQTAARVLARLDLPAGAPLPQSLEALAKEIVLSPTLERAEALATELRLAVARQRDAQAAQRDDAAAAKAMLEELPDDTPAPLLRALEVVAAGVARLDPALRDAQGVLDDAAADRESQEQSAAAIVLTESLRDLGYEVGDIEATLFADGGTVHFRRAGWENYFVRMRVNPDEHSVNFNVVRARGDEEGAERRRQDTLAEDRWCAEFPKLMQTLAARGLTLDVTRRLEAGAVPVQVVDPASVPSVAADEESGRPRAAPKARNIT